MEIIRSAGKDGSDDKLTVLGIHSNEPVFIIRGQDALSITTLEHYLTALKAVSSSGADIKDMNGILDRFRDWKPKKLPDGPHTQVVGGAR